MNAETLVDPLCGVVRAITEYEPMAGAPAAYTYLIADVADTRRFGIWLADRVAAGTSFGDARIARGAAIGEAVERYCGNNIPAGLRRATVEELAAGGIPHLRPEELPVYAAQQHDRPSFPYRRFAPDEAVLWARGTDATGEECWAPGSLVYLNWHQGARRREPRHHHLNYTGIATGTSVADARRRALLEVVERDAAVLWWQLELPARGVRVESVPGLVEAWRGSRLELHLVALPTELGVPVLAALVYDPVQRIPAAGFSCHPDPAAAAHKAALEALQVWVATHGVLDADGLAFEAMSRGILAKHAYLPWRADRRYLDDVGPDFARVRDLATQAQVWLDDRLHPLLRRFTAPASTVELSDVAPGDLDALDARLADAGRRVVTVDVTTSDVAATGLRVVRVLVSGLIPNAPAAFPYLGCPRLADVAAAHGLPGPPPATLQITLTPPPHL